jgi:NAD(P)-binding Rossmann-like domain
MSRSGSDAAYAGPKRVAIFGAGIAGLTAAHELVERGFEVEVFEPTEPSLVEWPPGGEPRAMCAVGGIARTQWSRADRPSPYAPPPSSMSSTQPLQFDAERELARRVVRFSRNASDLTQAGKQVVTTVAKLLSQLQQHEPPPGYPPDQEWRPYEGIRLEVRGYINLHEAQNSITTTLGTPLDRARADAVLTQLANELKALNVPIPLRAAGLGLAYGTDFTKHDDDRCIVAFQIGQDYLPGEHGFRFFPSFYQNLRDTMKRTPLPVDAVEPFVETFRTAFDNLVPAKLQAVLMAPPRPPYVLPRQRVASVQELFDLLVKGLETSGFTLTDINRLCLALFKYMTSCPKRRKGYEALSWWDFLEGERFSPEFQKYLDSVPQALLAFTARECDARTYGNITLQLLRDQVYDTEDVDGVLNGPTSVVWLDPWRRYLENQGVKFRRGKLLSFEVVDTTTSSPVTQKRIFPTALIWPDRSDHTNDDTAKPPTQTLVVRDYYLIALSPYSLQQEVLRSIDPPLEGRDIECIRRLKLRNSSSTELDGVLRNLSGLQYYFRTPLNILRGHVLYADSVWGLSSISQPQFWVRKRGWWDGYLSLLTVCIGNWDQKVPEGDEGSNVKGKTARECTREQIAREVWRQIKQSLPEGTPAPEPILYHLAESIKFDPSTGIQSHIEAGLLMNRPRMQEARPGRLDREQGYEMYYGNLVFAGTQMQTFTRLTTMEAANESGRHAVNAILYTESLEPNGVKRERCVIHNPEEHEMTDVQYFIDLDAALCDQGLPHFVDILDPGELPKEWLKGALTLGGFASLLGTR